MRFNPVTCQFELPAAAPSEGGGGTVFTQEAWGAASPRALAVAMEYTGVIPASCPVTLPSAAANANAEILVTCEATVPIVITMPLDAVRQAGGTGYLASVSFEPGNVEMRFRSNGIDWRLADSSGSPRVSASVNIAASEIDWSAGDFFYETLAGDKIYSFVNVGAGQTILVELRNPSNHTVTWPAAVVWPGGAAPVMTTGDRVDVYTFYSRDGTTVRGVAAQDYPPS